MHKLINPKHLDRYKVRIQHHRFFKQEYTNSFNQGLIPNHEFATLEDANPRGGATTVNLIHKQSGLEYTGYSFCSTRDSFSRKIGASEALRRAYLLAEANDPVLRVQIQVENKKVFDLLVENGYSEDETDTIEV